MAPPQDRTKKPGPASPVPCFLCGAPIEPAEIEDAFERVREDLAPPGVEFAHEECADQAGLWEEADEDADAPPRGRREARADDGGHGIRRILVPVAFSETVPALVHHAMEIVRGRGAEVRLLHVVGPPVAIMDPVMGSALDPAVLRRIRDSAEARLREIAAGIRGIAADAKVVTGSPARQILKEAESWGADVIVIGTHGRTGVRRALLGSVAEVVVRRAPCPVLTVRHSRFAAVAGSPPVGSPE